MHEATILDLNPLGICRGARPWLGRNANESCNQPSRLLIRTASNAYFPQVVSVLSLPDRGTAVQTAVKDLWDDLQIVDAAADLTFLKKKPKIAEKLAAFTDDEVLVAVREAKSGRVGEKPVKQVELEALLAAPEGFGDDVPVDPDFHARRLPDHVWRRSGRSDGIASVIQLHRLREVVALVGFTRLEAVAPDINGEYESDVERAELALDPKWFPAVENRGEGLFVQLRADAIKSWLDRPAVKQRLDLLAAGHARWAKEHKSKRLFPGGPYVLLHTFSHLLLQSLSMRCGYPTSSLHERIYSDYEAKRFGVLVYTGSPDAEGTLGGLVQQARHFEDHLAEALRISALCSNDPICAQHAPGQSMEGRWLHGAACHGCALVAETSCEMRNDYLDRSLVVPVLGVPNAAFFAATP
jgi:MrfA Zn-binding domain